MKRRLLAIAVVGAAHVLALAQPASASAHQVDPGHVSLASRGDWVCIGAGVIDGGFCQGDPLPDQLPLPVVTIPV